MANSIFKLKVETSEYDQKLANAAKGIRHLADVAHKGGGELTGLEKAELDYIKALGDMETKSRSASGQVRELSGSYKELKVIYDQLNEVEKADEGGKALAASLETLKTRAQEAKTQLDTATQSLNDNGEAGKGTSSVMEMLKDKFTVNIDAVKLFNIGLQAAEGALNVAKDAFFNNEEQLDEWGRVVESSHSLYQGFLNALNTGDISGYLSNINQIVQAARDAYDALDALGTYNAFNQINVERSRTNMTESIADYRGGKGSKDTVKAAGEAYKKELQDRKRLENEAYLAAVKRVAAERGVSAKDLTDALSGTYGHYQDLKNVQPTGVRQTVVGAGMFARTGTETFAQNRQEKLGEALRHLNDTELQSLQALGAQAQRTGNEIAQVDKQLTRVLNGRQPGEVGGRSGGTAKTTSTQEVTYASDSIIAQQKLVQDLTKKWNEAGADVRNQYVQPLVEAEAKLKEMRDQQALMKEQAQGKLKGDTPDGNSIEIPISSNISFDTWMNDVKDQLDNLKFDPIEIPIETTTKDVRAIAMAARTTADVVGSIGDAFNAIEDPAAKVMGTVMQAVASVALGYAQALVQAGSMGPWAWVAFAATGLATMISTISAIHSATGYAEGGIVGGNSYSGDNVFAGNAMVNSGELILNHAQQNAVASELQSGPRAIQVTGRLRGSDIVLSIDRELQQSGRGQLLTWG